MEINIPITLKPQTLAFFQRLLGPLAEAGDFLSDKIRFYRWKSSLATITEAQRICQLNGLSPQEVPFKILVPLLEKSSLEDEGSNLTKTWAMLLATASCDPKSINTNYSYILEKMTSMDVEFLNEFITRSRIDEIQAFGIINDSIDQYGYNVDEVALINVYNEGNLNLILDKINSIFQNFVFDPFDKDSFFECIRNSVGSQSRLMLLESVAMSSKVVDGNSDPLKYHHIFSIPGYSSELENCIACGVVERVKIYLNRGEYLLRVIVSHPTALGIGFVKACRGDNLISRDNS